MTIKNCYERLTRACSIKFVPVTLACGSVRAGLDGKNCAPDLRWGHGVLSLPTACLLVGRAGRLAPHDAHFVLTLISLGQYFQFDQDLQHDSLYAFATEVAMACKAGESTGTQPGCFPRRSLRSVGAGSGNAY